MANIEYFNDKTKEYESCIKISFKSYYAAVHQWQLDLCEGDKVAAALLNYVISWHNSILKKIEEKKEKNQYRQWIVFDKKNKIYVDVNKIQYHTMEQIQKGIMSIGGRKSIERARKILRDKKLITEHRNYRNSGDRTLQMLFHPKVCNAYLRSMVHLYKEQQIERDERLNEQFNDNINKVEESEIEILNGIDLSFANDLKSDELTPEKYECEVENIPAGDVQNDAIRDVQNESLPKGKIDASYIISNKEDNLSDNIDNKQKGGFSKKSFCVEKKYLEDQNIFPLNYPKDKKVCTPPSPPREKSAENRHPSLGADDRKYLGVVEMLRFSNFKEMRVHIGKSQCESLRKGLKSLKSVENHFNDGRFLESFKDYLEMRKDKGHPAKSAVTIKKLMNIFSKHTTDDCIIALDKSCSAGWTGVFPKAQKPKSNIQKAKEVNKDMCMFDNYGMEDDFKEDMSAWDNV